MSRRRDALTFKHHREVAALPPADADALRTATLQRLAPRLGLGANASTAVVVSAIAQRYSGDQNAVHHILFGPVPSTDADLLQLAHALDDIERQVTTS